MQALGPCAAGNAPHCTATRRRWSNRHQSTVTRRREPRTQGNHQVVPPWERCTAARITTSDNKRATTTCGSRCHGVNRGSGGSHRFFFRLLPEVLSDQSSSGLHMLCAAQFLLACVCMAHLNACKLVSVMFRAVSWCAVSEMDFAK